MQSNTKQRDWSTVATQMSCFFSEEVEKIARVTQFVRRKSPVNGRSFLKALVFGFLKKPDASLNDLAQECAELGVEVSAQGIDERINGFSVAFLKASLEKAFAMFRVEVPLPLAILQQFSAIFLVDSTFHELPAGLAEEYPGPGGDASVASLKIQLVYELLRGNWAHLAFQAGRQADQAYRDYLKVAIPGSLFILDLGYFCLDAFRQLVRSGAYFLSRHFYSVSLFFPAGQEIDLLGLLRKSDAILDLPVWIGNHPKYYIPCRLVAFRLPPEIAAERRRKAKLKEMKQGKPFSKNYLDLLDWSIFLTNIPTCLLNPQQVACLYRARWQIELIFKLWKSYCGIRHIRAQRQERILTELYAKLLGALLVNFLVAPLRLPDQTWTGRELSPVQIRKILSRFAQRLLLCGMALTDWIKATNDMAHFILRFGFKQKRRKKPNALSLWASAPPAPS